MEYPALTLSMIMERKEIPAEVHRVTSDTIENICKTADQFLWKLADDYYNMETRELDELAGALSVIINTVAEEVTAYRTDIIYDIRPHLDTKESSIRSQVLLYLSGNAAS